VGAAFADREACLDLYHASPYVIAELKKGAPFVAEPVVRVNLGSALACSIFETLRAMELPNPVEETI